VPGKAWIWKLFKKIVYNVILFGILCSSLFQVGGTLLWFYGLNKMSHGTLPITSSLNQITIHHPRWFLPACRRHPFVPVFGHFGRRGVRRGARLGARRGARPGAPWGFGGENRRG
jgi:hypothetical protein